MVKRRRRNNAKSKPELSAAQAAPAATMMESVAVRIERVQCLPAHEPPKAMQDEPRPQRQVRFDPNTRVVQYERAATDSESKARLFYTAKDFQNFRADLQQMVVLADEKQQQQQHSQDPHQNPDAQYNHMVSRLHRSCCDSEKEDASFATLPQELESDVHRFVESCHQAPPTLYGLERVAIREIYQVKILRREKMMDRIQSIQDCVLWGDDSSQVAEQIRAECEKITLPSRAFAAQWARVSASAA